MEKLNHYSIEEVIDTYQIIRTKKCQVLNEWLSNTVADLKDHEVELLKALPLELEDAQYAWNEEELKMYFIAPLIRIANINQKGVVGTFFERKLKGIVENITISVTCDCMVATPKLSGNPDVPYFFLQVAPSRPSSSEGVLWTKGKEKKKSHDPEGQMLAAMILAQSINPTPKPLFGSWIQGRFWYFTVLINKEYCVSQPFDATNYEDLLKIVFILKNLKTYIVNGQKFNFTRLGMKE